MKGHNDRICIIDASPSGVSGDKYLGALIDLGGSPDALRKVAKIVTKNLPGTRNIEVKIRKVERGEIGTRLVTVESDESAHTRKGSAILSSAKKCMNELGLSEWGSTFILSTVETLLDAESKVHGHSKGQIELHELGSADTLVDILGVASLIESLELDDSQWWSTPVAVGGGSTRFSNRSYSNPPPAVAEILREHRFPIERGPADIELSTPTGVAITANLVTMPSTSYPVFRPEAIGYGAGSKEIDGLANVLRITTGRKVSSDHTHDEIVILETNLDDVSGEIVGRAVEKLMEQGARDVTVTPVLMKKNRPGNVITVISSIGKAEKLASTLMEETGTLGVREIPVRRHIANREFSKIELTIGKQTYSIRVKLSRRADGTVIRAKPEFEDLKAIADRTDVTLRDLTSQAEKSTKGLLITKH